MTPRIKKAIEETCSRHKLAERRQSKNDYDFRTEAGMHRFTHDLLVLSAFAHTQYVHFPKGLKMPPRTAAMLKHMGAKNGAADWLVIVKGKAHWLELKKDEDEKPSADQIAFAEWSRKAGADYIVAKTPKEVRLSLYLMGAINVLADTVIGPSDGEAA